MPWDFPGGPVVKTVLPLKRVKVRSLVEELRSHRPLGVAKKKVMLGIQVPPNLAPLSRRESPRGSCRWQAASWRE